MIPRVDRHTDEKTNSQKTTALFKITQKKKMKNDIGRIIVTSMSVKSNSTFEHVKGLDDE